MAEDFDERAPWFQTSGYQLLATKLREYERLIEHIEAQDRIAPTKMATRARGYMHHTWLRMPFPRYDGAWSTLQDLRAGLCEKLDTDDLHAHMIEDVAADVDYLEPAKTGPVHTELATLRKTLQEAVLNHLSAAEKKVVQGDLAALSRRVGDARNSIWLKVNLKRSRYLLSGIILGALAAAGLVIVQFTSTTRAGVAFYLGVVVFGAIGGTISSLFSPDPLAASASQFYLTRRLLILRPLIGAAVAMVASLAVVNGTLSLFGINADSRPVGFFVLAFGAGFSERTVIRQIVAAAKGGKGAGGNSDS